MKFVLSYSCGKDSTLALHKMIEQGTSASSRLSTGGFYLSPSWAGRWIGRRWGSWRPAGWMSAERTANITP